MFMHTALFARRIGVMVIVTMIMIMRQPRPRRRRREQRERIFPAYAQQAEEEVDDLEDRDRAHAGVEVGGEEVPEEFGPEETLD